MYIFFWFFKQLFYILKRLVENKILLLLVFFIFALFLFFKPTFAFTTGDEIESTYGYYNGFTSSQISTINDYITANKGDYDSFICRGYNINNNTFITILFYNYNITGKVYKVYRNYNNYPYWVFDILSQNRSTDSVYYRTYLMPDLSFHDDGYFDTINQAVCTFDSNRDNFALYTNRDIYTNNLYNDVFFYGGNTDLFMPYITNSTSEIINFSFNNLIINARKFSF